MLNPFFFSIFTFSLDDAQTKEKWLHGFPAFFFFLMGYFATVNMAETAGWADLWSLSLFGTNREQQREKFKASAPTYSERTLK